MDLEKAEFKRLIELMGWSQTEAARRLCHTPSAINHLVNPDHPNKPTRTMMQLLKLIMARERPDLINPETFELKEVPPGTKPESARLSAHEGELVEKLRLLPPAERAMVDAVIITLFKRQGYNGNK